MIDATAVEPGFSSYNEKFRMAEKLIIDCIFGDRHILTLSPISTAAQLESPEITR